MGGTIYIICSEDMTKTRQNGFHQKSRFKQLKTFRLVYRQCLEKIFKIYALKLHVDLRKSGPFYLQPTVARTEIQCKRLPIGVYSINFIMKSIVQNSSSIYRQALC